MGYYFTIIKYCNIIIRGGVWGFSGGGWGFVEKNGGKKCNTAYIEERGLLNFLKNIAEMGIFWRKKRKNGQNGQK